MSEPKYPPVTPGRYRKQGGEEVTVTFVDPEGQSPREVSCRSDDGTVANIPYDTFVKTYVPVVG